MYQKQQYKGMSESEDDEIFDDEEISDSEVSGSINNSQIGSEFDEQKNSPKSNKSGSDDFADPSTKKKTEQETGAKGDFVTVPVTGNVNNSMDSRDGRETPSGKKENNLDDDEMEEMYEQDLGKLNWQEIFLEEKMSGEPQSIPQSVIYELVNETINKEAFSI